MEHTSKLVGFCQALYRAEVGAARFMYGPLCHCCGLWSGGGASVGAAGGERFRRTVATVGLDRKPRTIGLGRTRLPRCQPCGVC